MGTCSFLVYRSINSYLDFAAYSKYDLVFEAPARFPTVTTCNQNPFVTQRAYHYVKHIMKKNNISFESLENMTDLDGYQSFGLKLKQSVENVRYLALLDIEFQNDTDKFKRSMGLDRRDFMLSCEFETNECVDEDFDFFFDPWYGACFQFGKSSLKVSNKAGNYDGLIMHLFVGLPESDDKYSFSIRSGAHIIIHNQTTRASNYEGREALQR